MGRWSTLLLDCATLSEMPLIPAISVHGHFDAVAAQRPTPRGLYQRWEDQQWSVSNIELERDRVEWTTSVRGPVKDRVNDLVMSFLIGEYTGLDLLSPIMLACPDEASLEFLGTQVADETRHNRLMMRLAVEVLGLPEGTTDILTTAWNSITPAHRELSALESSLVRDLCTSTVDVERWVRAVTLFHLVTEGVLALRAQRVLITVLRRFSILPGIQAGFTAMLRDEARHVNFGLHALRDGLRQGYEDAMLDVLDQALPLIMTIDTSAARPTAGRTELRTGARILRELELRLRQLGASARLGEQVSGRGQALLDRMRCEHES